MKQIGLRVVGSPRAYLEVGGAFATKSALIAALDAEIDAVAEEVVGVMPTADREARLHEIEDETLRHGYDEDALIRMAAEAGHGIVPRGSADVRAVLGLSPDAPPPNKTLPLPPPVFRN